ncbi:hypothetical protein [Phormidesmis priestleyi]
MKRTVVGVLWFVALFFGSCFSVGLVVGAVGPAAGLKPEEVQQKAGEAGERLSGLIILASAGAAIHGTVNRKLPGTK